MANDVKHTQYNAVSFMLKKKKKLQNAHKKKK